MHGSLSGPLSSTGLLELSTPVTHAPRHHCPVGELLPRLLTLTFAVKSQGGCFLLRYVTLADIFPLGSGLPYVARTFLLLLVWGKRQAGQLFYNGQKYDFCVDCHCFFVFLKPNNQFL